MIAKVTDLDKNPWNVQYRGMGDRNSVLTSHHSFVYFCLNEIISYNILFIANVSLMN